MDIKIDKLYVCLNDENDKFSLHTRQEIDDIIEKAELGNTGSLDYTVIGYINTQDIANKHFAIVFNDETSKIRNKIYDVIQADSTNQAQAIIEEKPRFQRKTLSFKRFVDLTDLVNEYFS